MSNLYEIYRKLEVEHAKQMEAVVRTRQAVVTFAKTFLTQRPASKLSLELLRKAIYEYLMSFKYLEKVTTKTKDGKEKTTYKGYRPTTTEIKKWLLDEGVNENVIID